MISGALARYALPVALGVALSASGTAWWLLQRNSDLKEQLAAARASLASCDARVKHILDDKERDDEVDNVPHDDLRDFGSRWLRDATSPN